MSLVPDSTTPAPPAPQSAIAFWMVAVALSVATFGAFFVIPYLPTNDGPGHILGAWWWNHANTPGQLWSERVTPQWPLSGGGFVAFFWILEPLLGWRETTALLLASSSLLSAWGVIVLGRVVQQRWHWPTLLAFCAAFSWPLYMGFFNFLVAAAFVPWIAAAVLAPGEVDRRTALWLAPVLLVVGWLHLFAALAAGAVLVSFAITSRSPIRSVAWLAAASIPVGGLIVLTIVGGGDSSSAPIAAVVAWLDEPARIDIFARTIVSGPRWRAEGLVVVAVIGVVATLATRGRPRSEHGLAALALAFFAATAFAPFNATGWQGFAPRFGGFALGFALAVMPWPRRGRLAAALMAATAAYAGVSVGWAWTFHARLATDYAPALEGLGARAPTNGYRAFIAFEPTFAGEASRSADVPIARFGPNTAALYVLAQGGIARVFHSLPVSPVRIVAEEGRELPEIVPAWGFQFGDLATRADAGGINTDEAQTLRELERHWVFVAAAYDDAILFGPREARDRIIARGFDAPFNGESVSLVRFEGCTLRFALPRSVPQTARSIAVSGLGPSPSMPFRQGGVELDASGLFATVRGAPCGSDVEVAVQVDADGQPGDAGDVSCHFVGTVGAGQADAPCEP